MVSTAGPPMFNSSSDVMRGPPHTSNISYSALVRSLHLQESAVQNITRIRSVGYWHFIYSSIVSMCQSSDSEACLLPVGPLAFMFLAISATRENNGDPSWKRPPLYARVKSSTTLRMSPSHAAAAKASRRVGTCTQSRQFLRTSRKNCQWQNAKASKANTQVSLQAVESNYA